jgi:hypothetical protein
MLQQRIIGVALLVVGIVCVVVGMNASHSVADQVSKTFTGRFTEATTWYIIGGIASGLIGMGMIAAGIRGTRA